MTINEYLKATINLQKLPNTRITRRPRPRVVCKDGFSISVQANSGTYCTPRENDLTAYSEVELGYPSEGDLLIANYAEDFAHLTDTVYGYVPVELVDQLLEKHGGIAYGISIKGAR